MVTWLSASYSKAWGIPLLRQRWLHVLHRSLRGPTTGQCPPEHMGQAKTIKYEYYSTVWSVSQQGIPSAFVLACKLWFLKDILSEPKLCVQPVMCGKNGQVVHHLHIEKVSKTVNFWNDQYHWDEVLERRNSISFEWLVQEWPVFLYMCMHM